MFAYWGVRLTPRAKLWTNRIKASAASIQTIAHQLQRSLDRPLSVACRRQPLKLCLSEFSIGSVETVQYLGYQSCLFSGKMDYGLGKCTAVIEEITAEPLAFLITA